MAVPLTGISSLTVRVSLTVVLSRHQASKGLFRPSARLSANHGWEILPGTCARDALECHIVFLLCYNLLLNGTVLAVCEGSGIALAMQNLFKILG